MTESAPPPVPPKLTLKQAAFRDAILAGYPPSEAYRKAFSPKVMSKKAISVQAQKILNYKNVRLAIRLAVNGGQVPTVLQTLSPTVRLSMEERLEELRCAARLNPADCFDELNHFKSIREMPEHVQRAIAGFEVDPISFVIKVKFIDKIAAIMSYSKLAGDIPRDPAPVAPRQQQRYDLSKLTDEELKAYMRLRQRALVQQEGPTP